MQEKGTVLSPRMVSAARHGPALLHRGFHFRSGRLKSGPGSGYNGLLAGAGDGIAERGAGYCVEISACVSTHHVKVSDPTEILSVILESLHNFRGDMTWHLLKDCSVM
jgi:hypothetical protein